MRCRRYLTSTAFSLLFLNPRVSGAPQDGADIARSRDACASLTKSLGGESVYLPGQQVYIDSRTQNWSESCWLSPGCIVAPSTTQEVAAALKVIKKHQAPFQIRGGGHMTNPGWSNIDNGVLISLAKLNSLDVVEIGSNKIARLGPGNYWTTVYQYLSEQGLTVPGARYPTVGMGSNMGGGLSFLTDIDGFSVDSIANYEVVLANATVVNANATSNPDLWWALKGGTTNFGVVTRFDLYTFPEPSFWARITSYDSDTCPELLQRLAKFQLEVAEKSGSFTLGVVTIVRGDGCQLVQARRLLEGNSSNSDYGALGTLPSLTETVIPTIPHSAFVSAQGELPFGGSRHTFQVVSSLPHAELYEYSIGVFQNLSEGLGEKAVLHYYPQMITTKMIGAGAAAGRGPNALGLKNTAQTWHQLAANWYDEADDKLIEGKIREASAKIKNRAKELGVFLEFLFMNDAGSDQNPLLSYGSDILRRFREVSRRYDPSGMFQTLRRGGYKLR